MLGVALKRRPRWLSMLLFTSGIVGVALPTTSSVGRRHAHGMCRWRRGAHCTSTRPLCVWRLRKPIVSPVLGRADNRRMRRCSTPPGDDWAGDAKPMAAMKMAAAMKVARKKHCYPTSLVDEIAQLKGRSDVPCPAWPVATHQGELTARRLVITFVPTTGRKLAAWLSAAWPLSSWHRA